MQVSRIVLENRLIDSKSFNELPPRMKEAMSDVFKQIENETGNFCHGDKPGFADTFLIPQIYNANRFECDLSKYPKLLRINEVCLELDAFKNAVPEKQPDAL